MAASMTQSRRNGHERKMYDLAFPVLDIAEQMVRGERKGDRRKEITSNGEYIQLGMEGNVEINSNKFSEKDMVAKTPANQRELSHLHCLSGPSNENGSLQTGKELPKRQGYVDDNLGISPNHSRQILNKNMPLCDNMLAVGIQSTPNLQNSQVYYNSHYYPGHFSEENYQSYPCMPSTQQCFPVYNMQHNQGCYISNSSPHAQHIIKNTNQNVWQPMPHQRTAPIFGHELCAEPYLKDTGQVQFGIQSSYLPQAWSQGTPKHIPKVEESEIKEIEDKLKDSSQVKKVIFEKNQTPDMNCIVTVAPSIKPVMPAQNNSVLEVNLAPPSFYKHVPPPNTDIVATVCTEVISKATSAAVVTKPSGDKVYIPLDDSMYELKHQGHDLDEMPDAKGETAFKKESELYDDDDLSCSPRPIRIKGSISDEDMSETDYTTDASRSYTSISTQNSKASDQDDVQNCNDIGWFEENADVTDGQATNESIEKETQIQKRVENDERQLSDMISAEDVTADIDSYDIIQIDTSGGSKCYEITPEILGTGATADAEVSVTYTSISPIPVDGQQTGVSITGTSTASSTTDRVELERIGISEHKNVCNTDALVTFLTVDKVRAAAETSAVTNENVLTDACIAETPISSAYGNTAQADAYILDTNSPVHADPYCQDPCISMSQMSSPPVSTEHKEASISEETTSSVPVDKACADVCTSKAPVSSSPADAATTNHRTAEIQSSSDPMDTEYSNAVSTENHSAIAENSYNALDYAGISPSLPFLPEQQFYETHVSPSNIAWSGLQSTQSTQWYTQNQASSFTPHQMESPIGEAYHFNETWYHPTYTEPCSNGAVNSAFVQNVPQAETGREDQRPAFPALHISDDGLVTVILRHGVYLEMTTDKALRLVCHDRKLVVATNRDGSSACLIHPAAKVFQNGTTVDVDLYLARKVKIMTENTVFGNNFNTYVFDYSMIERLDGFAEYTDLSEDKSVDYLVTDTGFFNFEVALRTSEIVSRAYFEMYQNTGCKVIVNGVKIVQNDNGEVSVYSGPIRFLRLSPLKSILRFRSQFLEVDIETNWNVKLRRGTHSLNASYLGLILSNGKIKACLDEKNKLQAFILPDHHRLYLGQRAPQPRPSVPRQRYINLPQRRGEPEGDHWGYMRH